MVSVRSALSAIGAALMLLLAGGSAVAESQRPVARVFGDCRLVSIKLRMTIADGGGSRIREMSLASARDGTSSKLLIAVSSPSYLSKLAFLLLEDGRSRRRWVRGSSGSRRLGESDGGERLFGSDFTVDDLGDLMEEAARVTLLGASGAGQTAYRAEFPDGHRRVVLEDRDGLIRSVEYFDLAGQATRSYIVEEVGERGSYRYPRRSVMRSAKAGTWTSLEVIEIDDETPIPDRIFNPAAF